jgi:hypothetical protein
MITLINNKKDWEKFYYYKGYSPKAYPKSYPCYAKRETEGGGLAGEYEAHYVVYPLNVQTVELAFLAGMKAEWKFIC